MNNILIWACHKGQVAVETCMCGRILAQKGETCVKDDTVRPADAGNKKKSFLSVYYFFIRYFYSAYK